MLKFILICKQFIISCILLFFLVSIPLIIKESYILHFMNLIGLTMLIVLGLNIVWGYCGQMSLAQGPFCGLGAYTSVILSMKCGLPVWLSIPLAGFFVAIIGGLVGIPSLRLAHFYLAVVTLGLGEVILAVIINTPSLTRGMAGIVDIPSLELFGFSFNTAHRFYYCVLFVDILGLWFSSKLLRSHVGRAFIAIKNNQIIAETMGISSVNYKTFAFVISAVYAGIAGALYAHFVQFISPEYFTLEHTTLNTWLMLLIGGIGANVWGPIIGTIILSILEEIFRPFQLYRMLIYGLIILILVIALPGGSLAIRAKLTPFILSRKPTTNH